MKKVISFDFNICCISNLKYITFCERMDRRPLHGTSYDSIIHTLRINGILVDYAIETTNIHGDPLFFWYFSDFSPLEGSQEDIIISFNGYE